MWKAIAVYVMAGCRLVVPEALRADVFDDAVRLCTAIEQTGMSTEGTTSGYRQTVDVRFQTNAAEAQKICTGLVEVAARQKLGFAGKWKLRVFSPDSGEHPIAVCTLKSRVGGLVIVEECLWQALSAMEGSSDGPDQVSPSASMTSVPRHTPVLAVVH